MSHAIEIQNGQALAAFRREPAWHTLGTVLDTVDLSDAGLTGWDIQPAPVFVLIDGQYVPVDPSLGQVMTRNLVTTGQRVPLSMVGPSTVPHQNEHLEQFARAMLEIGATDDNPLEIEAAGSLHDGKRVWIVFRIPGTFDIGGDKIERYVVIETSHGGKGATRAYVTHIRVVCKNTLSAASSMALAKYIIRHNGPVIPQMAVQAREVLNLHLKVDPALAELVSDWQDTKVTDAQWEAIVKDLVPDAPKAATDRQKRTVSRKRIMLNDLYFVSPTVGEFRGTKWGAVNAITEAYQWAPGSQTSAESLAKRQMTGAAANERLAVRTVDAVLANA